jgi:virulence factor Mce-like protein
MPLTAPTSTRRRPGMSAAIRGTLRRPWAVILVVLLVIFALWAKGTRSQPYHVKAVFDGALSILPGLRVEVDGIDVGKVSSVKFQDGEAIVGLGINDDRIRPLHQGTTATIRFGTTIGNGTREIELHPGPASAPEIPEGGIISSSHTTTPVEFDQLFDTLDRRTREQLRGMLGNTAGALRGQAGALNRGLGAAPRGLSSVGDVMSDLASDEFALRSLVVDADRATSTLAARRAEISDLVSVAAATFDTFAAHTRQVQDSIQGLAPTLRETRSTLARLDPSVDTLDGLMTALRPGARELAPVATRLERATRQLARTVPVARRTIATGTQVAPSVTALLRKGVPFMGRLQGTLGRLSPMLGCLRPYSPEIAGMLETWVGFTKNYDGTSHYARIHVREGTTSANVNPLTSAQAVGSDHGLRYAMPRPPGLNAGQPWLLPECGAGHAALDAGSDPEAKR